MLALEVPAVRTCEHLSEAARRVNVEPKPGEQDSSRGRSGSGAITDQAVCPNGKASRPARLCRRVVKNIKPADSRYDRGTSGGQVTSIASRQCVNHSAAS
jgi:hypothetical protein